MTTIVILFGQYQYRDTVALTSALAANRLHRKGEGSSTTAFTALWGVALSALLVGGCNDSLGAVPIRGKVSYHGDPISNGTLTFFPQSGRQVSTALDEHGEYATELPAGEYRVTVSVGVVLPPGYKEGNPIPPQKVVLPTNYTTQARTPLKANVAEDQQAAIDFALQ